MYVNQRGMASVSRCNLRLTFRSAFRSCVPFLFYSCVRTPYPSSDTPAVRTQLAKADAKAVRAAAEDAAAAAAAAAEAEAAWAAAGVGSGGGGGENAMLFLECEVNGRALRAFVDTGAQVRFVSPRTTLPVLVGWEQAYGCSPGIARETRRNGQATAFCFSAQDGKPVVFTLSARGGSFRPSLSHFCSSAFSVCRRCHHRGSELLLPYDGPVPVHAQPCFRAFCPRVSPPRI